MFNPQGYSYMIIDTTVSTLRNSSDTGIKTETVSLLLTFNAHWYLLLHSWHPFKSHFTSNFCNSMDLYHFCSKEDFFFEEGAGDMGNRNRLVSSGCPLLLRNIPIFNIYVHLLRIIKFYLWKYRKMIAKSFSKKYLTDEGSNVPRF